MEVHGQQSSGQLTRPRSHEIELMANRDVSTATGRRDVTRDSSRVSLCGFPREICPTASVCDGHGTGSEKAAAANEAALGNPLSSAKQYSPDPNTSLHRTEWS